MTLFSTVKQTTPSLKTTHHCTVRAAFTALHVAPREMVLCNVFFWYLKSKYRQKEYEQIQGQWNNLFERLQWLATDSQELVLFIHFIFSISISLVDLAFQQFKITLFTGKGVAVIRFWYKILNKQYFTDTVILDLYKHNCQVWVKSQLTVSDQDGLRWNLIPHAANTTCTANRKNNTAVLVFVMACMLPQWSTIICNVPVKSCNIRYFLQW